MLKIKSSGLMLIVLLALHINILAQQFDSPGEYNNYIVNEQRKITKKNIRYIIKAAHSENDNKIEAKRQDVVKQIEKSLKKIKKMPDYDGNSDFRDEAIAVLDLYLYSFEIDFKLVNKLQVTRSETFEAMEKYFEAQDRAEQKLNDAEDRFDEAQKKFAEENGMELQEDKRLQKILQQISDVNKYSRSIYLIYFKVQKLNVNFFDYMKEKDAVAMENTREEIISASEEAIAKLKEIDDFNGDINYRNKTKAMIMFYKEKAEEDYIVLVKIIEMGNSIDNDDIRQYNKIIESYNNTSQRLNDALNRAQTTLMQRNIPKDDDFMD